MKVVVEVVEVVVEVVKVKVEEVVVEEEGDVVVGIEIWRMVVIPKLSERIGTAVRVHSMACIMHGKR